MVSREKCARGRVVRYPQRARMVLGVFLTRQPCVAHGRRAINCLRVRAGYQRSSVSPRFLPIPLFPPCLDQIACRTTDCGQRRRCTLQHIKRCPDEYAGYGGPRTYWPLMFQFPLPQQVCCLLSEPHLFESACIAPPMPRPPSITSMTYLFSSVQTTGIWHALSMEPSRSLIILALRLRAIVLPAACRRPTERSARMARQAARASFPFTAGCCSGADKTTVKIRLTECDA